ncbi:hypothetical protein [Brachyspira murdochii]|uniref:hypothetical protein n=1 Tax=Brachyspira murdochii TaxID=84378 RepID=UPI0012F50019|nr:hypothetical protein [Brachyspira murdochii]
MFKLNVTSKEKDGFIYKIMNIDFGNRINEVYFKIPISEKELLTKSYDPFVVFNIYNMMEVGGDCYIKGSVNKSLLDNLEMYVDCWKVWMPDKCKSINIIADEEIDDHPKKLNDDAVLCYSGGLDSTATLYRHYNNLAGRNNKNIKKLIRVIGGRDAYSRCRENNNELNEQLWDTYRQNDIILNDIGFKPVYIESNMRFTKEFFAWGDEFIALYLSTMMLYQDIYHNIILASDEPVLKECIEVPHASNPISNRFLQSNQFRLITDGEFLTRPDKINILKNSNNILNRISFCDRIHSTSVKNCGICHKCIVTKLAFLATKTDINFDDIFDNPNLDLETIGNPGPVYSKLYKEIIYYNNINKVLDEKIIIKIKNIIDKCENYEMYNTIEEITDKNNKLLDKINKIAWWIPIKKWRDNFRKNIFM